MACGTRTALMSGTNVPVTGKESGSGSSNASAVMMGWIESVVRRSGSKYTRSKLIVSPAEMGLE